MIESAPRSEGDLMAEARAIGTGTKQVLRSVRADLAEIVLNRPERRNVLITSTLINSLQWHDRQFGLETMCVGGGPSMAMVLERLS